MRHTSRLIIAPTIVGLWLVGAHTVMGQPVRLAGTTCSTPPAMHCPDAGCPGDVVTNGGAVTEAGTGRTYFLDYPCDLKKGEKVTFILSLHGGGSYGNWQRHYFPILDDVAKHRLVVATPFSPRRVWAAEDDEYLQNIVNSVIEQIGREQIKAFWLAGHSQGGLTSRRLVCTDFFAGKVDGFLSLSGGRLGGSPERPPNAGPPPAASTTSGAPAAAPGAGRGPGAFTPPPPPTCDFSHIYTTGEHEIVALPKTSEWAQKYGCAATPKARAIEDTKAGYVYDRTRQNPGTKPWGVLPRPGSATTFVYPGCRDGKVVADVVRLDKGHTEGLEPNVTEELVKLMLSARGGKIQRDRGVRGTAGTGQAAKSQAELRKAFIGTWRLVSIEGGTNPTNRGAKPTGLIYYDATGHMAAQIQPDRPRPTWTGTPTPEQAREAMRGYTAYFGTYTIDDKARTVTHHREGMLDGGAVDFVRTYEFAPGDRLILTPVGNTTSPTHLTWERIK